LIASKATTHFDGSVAKAFLILDWETPNCRAIRDGVAPALNAARIAFTRPRVNGTSAISTFRCLLVGGDRFLVISDGRKADGATSVPTLLR
jgi:hypothetical protein